jgi:RNA polymerase sigma factor (sigma-70 family)
VDVGIEVLGPHGRDGPAGLRYDPARGKFATYAAPRIRGAILDAARMELPKGFRRDKEAARAVFSLGARVSDEETLADAIAASELPVGWEVESQDEVAAVTSALPQQHRLAVRAVFTECQYRLQKQAGPLLGVSESRVSQIVKESFALLKGD